MVKDNQLEEQKNEKECVISRALRVLGQVAEEVYVGPTTTKLVVPAAAD